MLLKVGVDDVGEGLGIDGGGHGLEMDGGDLRMVVVVELLSSIRPRAASRSGIVNAVPDLIFTKERAA